MSWSLNVSSILTSIKRSGAAVLFSWMWTTQFYTPECVELHRTTAVLHSWMWTVALFGVWPYFNCWDLPWGHNCWFGSPWMRANIGQEVQEGGWAAGQPHSSRDNPPRCSGLLAPREGLCWWLALIKVGKGTWQSLVRLCLRSGKRKFK